MLLMTDGTVLVHYVTEDSSGNLYPSGIWERLTPDAYGNYSDGTWSTLPTMPAGYAPKFHATAVLPDGRVLVEGGEYNGTSGQVETNLGSIYDPVANSWTSVSPPPGASEIGDAQSVVLPNGTLMLGDCCSGVSALFNASSLSWAQTGNDKKDLLREEGWVLLPNGKVLTVDLNNQSNGTTSELYNPSTQLWSPSGTVPVPLEYTACDEMGPMVLRPDGTVTAIGGNGQLATYDSSTGAWSAGPLIGNNLGASDGPGVLLPDGNVFFQVSTATPDNPGNYSCYGNNSAFFEWDGTSLTEEPGPPDEPGDAPAYEGRMLVLPTGQVLYDDAYYTNNKDQDKNLFLYTPAGTYQSAWQPTISSVATTLYAGSMNNSISGTQLNGLSQGAMYGDDEQMAENFPLVRITNNATGHVFYFRTHSFSTMAVATGSTPVTAQFDVPENIEYGPSTLEVVADGIPSNPVAVTIPSPYATGTFTVTGTEQAHEQIICPRTPQSPQVNCTYNWYYDVGAISVTVGNFTVDADNGQGDTDASVAAEIASGLNASGSPVTATANGSTVTVTSKAQGTGGDYSLSSACLSYSTAYFTHCSFTATPSGATMTGGYIAENDAPGTAVRRLASAARSAPIFAAGLPPGGALALRSGGDR